MCGLCDVGRMHQVVVRVAVLGVALFQLTQKVLQRLSIDLKNEMLFNSFPSERISL